MKVRQFAITSSALRHLCKSMQALVLSVTSSLRQKNAKAVDFYSLQNKLPEDINMLLYTTLTEGIPTDTGISATMPMNPWQGAFLLELLHRGYSTRDILEFLRNIQPFITYLEYVNEYGITGIEPEHIQAYVAQQKTLCHAACSARTVLFTNKRIAAIKMFCLQMVIAGKLPYDYAADIDLVAMPHTTH